MTNSSAQNTATPQSPANIVIGSERVDACQLQTQLADEIRQLELRLQQLTAQPRVDQEAIDRFNGLLEERRALLIWASQQDLQTAS